MPTMVTSLTIPERNLDKIGLSCQGLQMGENISTNTHVAASACMPLTTHMQSTQACKACKIPSQRTIARTIRDCIILITLFIWELFY